ncbi:MAG: hypothetical protein JRJ42_05500 [Deltaproteobacteria bacterium]|nr:hypothetical protein [Deltaproteobacteria bacterium]MBW2019595.1 hypothetical protein [Deltaproteobacteria bacterium]MBW2074410.1 hypothetical protein [Deltaproteobacteria bacterium]
MGTHNIATKREIYHKIASFIPPEAWRSTVAIVLIDGEELHQFGTGTLLSVADQPFIVTAAHVIKTAYEYNKSLCVPGEDRSFVQLPATWVCSAEGQYGTSEDPFDIAVLKLDPVTADRLRGKSFLRLNDVSLTNDLATGIFGRSHFLTNSWVFWGFIGI